MERELEYWAPGAADPQPIRVRIGTPVQDVSTADGVDWSCTLTIEGLDAPYSMRLYDVDAIGAMLAAATLAPAVLRSYVPPGGRLTRLGSEELGFPSLSQLNNDWQYQPADGSAARRLSVKISHPERTGDSWSALVTVLDYSDHTTLERRLHGPTWANVLEHAAGAVSVLLQEVVNKAGGGTLTEVDNVLACRIGAEGTVEGC
jgi:hypothetical protein